LGKRFLEWKFFRFRPPTNLGKQVSEMQIFEMKTPPKKIGLRFLASKLLRLEGPESKKNPSG